MTRNFVSILAGVAAIAMVAAPPLAATAEPAPVVAQRQQNQQQNPLVPLLGLTEAQQTQWAALQQEAAEQLGNVITAAQQARFLTARRNGKERQEAVDVMALSDTQKTRIRQITRLSQQKFFALLTEEQQVKLFAAMPEQQRVRFFNLLTAAQQEQLKQLVEQRIDNSAAGQ